MSDEITARRHELKETRDPTVNDDVDQGFDSGSFWNNLSSQTFFVCVDATRGAAVWQQMA